MANRLKNTFTYAQLQEIAELMKIMLTSKPRHLYAAVKVKDVLSQKIDNKPVILKSQKKKDTDVLLIEATPELLALLRWRG